MKVTYTCEFCGNTVTKIRTPGNMIVAPRFCSQKCNAASKSKNAKGTAPNSNFTCIVCGKEVFTYRSPSQKNKNAPRFCSLQCLGKYQEGNKNPAWTGGRHLQAGYIVVFYPDHPFADCKGFVYEHRLIMEQKIGRLLQSLEVVHHINGKKTDNRPENLLLFKNNSEHLKFHQKTKGTKDERD